MANQTISVRRMVVTNLLILTVIALVGFLSLHDGVSAGLSRAANAPVFIGKAGSGEVGLEIAFCGDADIEGCIMALQSEEVVPTLFFCPEFLERDPDILRKTRKTGYPAGIWICEKHDMPPVIARDTLVLGDFSLGNPLMDDIEGVIPVCWTLDANRAFARAVMDAKIDFGIYAKSIVLYRYTDDTSELHKLIRIIKEKGYNITDIKSML